MIKKTAVIIGASSDIGKAITNEMSKQGYNLALTYNTTPIETEEFEQNSKILTYHLDLLQNGAIEEFFKQIQSDFQYIDTLIYCAGIAQKRALIVDVTNEEVDKLFEINIKSTIKSIREFVKLTMNNHPANIVLIGSFVEKNGCSCESVYTATKSAMSGLAKSLASELGNLDVRINVVAPGFIDTKMNNNLTKEEKNEFADITPLKRLGNVQDVANAVVFLTDEKSSFITGQTIFVDGGLILE